MSGMVGQVCTSRIVCFKEDMREKRELVKMGRFQFDCLIMLM